MGIILIQYHIQLVSILEFSEINRIISCAADGLNEVMPLGNANGICYADGKQNLINQYHNDYYGCLQNGVNKIE